MDKVDFLIVLSSFTLGVIIGGVLGYLIASVKVSSRGYKILTDERGEIIGIAPA